MPKKIPIVETRLWLEEYENGKSEALIAREYRKDLRVIKRGINQARLERSGIIAQAEVVKEALVRHQNQLLGLVDRLQANLVLPRSNLEIRQQSDATFPPIPLGIAVVHENPKGNVYVEMTEEGNVLWRLLREHLKHEMLWKNLERWKNAMSEHVTSRQNVQSKLIELLEENTGIPVLQKPPKDGNTSYIDYHNTVRYLSDIAINRILEIPDETNPENTMIIDDVFIRNAKAGNVMAFCPKKEVTSRDVILNSFEEILKSSEISIVKKTNTSLTSILQKLQEFLEDIQLMGMVPNSCRICRKLIR